MSENNEKTNCPKCGAKEKPCFREERYDPRFLVFECGSNDLFQSPFCKEREAHNETRKELEGIRNDRDATACDLHEMSEERDKYKAWNEEGKINATRAIRDMGADVDRWRSIAKMLADALRDYEHIFSDGMDALETYDETEKSFNERIWGKDPK